MIPRHQPPFSLTALLSRLFQGTSREEIETGYAAQLGVKHAVLVPSARAGMYHFLLKYAGTHELIAPAYTCGVVHEAMVKSQIRFSFLDNETESFMMSPGKISDTIQPNHILLLCELYGLNYPEHIYGDQRMVAVPKIHDLAMTVPDKEMMKRLGPNDIALLSFGIGKCLFAGCGGLMLTNNDELAAYFRNIPFKNYSFSQSVKRSIDLLARTVLHKHLIYGISRKAVTALRGKNTADKFVAGPQTYPAYWHNINNDPDYVYLPATANRNMIRYHIAHADAYISRRKQIVTSYLKALKPGIAGADVYAQQFPMSHLPIMCRSNEQRERLAALLWKEGFDCASLYKIGSYIDPKRFPNTIHTSDTVLCLPVNLDLSETDIAKITRIVNQQFHS